MAIELKSDINVSGSLTVNGGPVGGTSPNIGQIILGTPDHVITRNATADAAYDYHVSGSGNQIVNVVGFEGAITGTQSVNLVLYPEDWDNNTVFAVVFRTPDISLGTGTDFSVTMDVQCSPTFEWYQTRSGGWVSTASAGITRGGTRLISIYTTTAWQALGSKSSNGTVNFSYNSYLLISPQNAYGQVGPQL